MKYTLRTFTGADIEVKVFTDVAGNGYAYIHNISGSGLQEYVVVNNVFKIYNRDITICYDGLYYYDGAKLFSIAKN